jgi:CheY-like chemotaxis protein
MQNRATTGASELGLGGLSTVFGFIKQSDGNIGVESKVGGDTTFRLFLPRFLDTAIWAEAPVPKDAGGGRETVLVVEDNSSVCRVVVLQLQALGYDVLQCIDAATALAKLTETHVDLLFTDIVIPGDVDGFQLARNAVARWPSLKVLLTTGFGDTAKRPDARGLAVLQKPYRSMDLARAVRSTLEGNGGSHQGAR